MMQNLVPCFLGSLASGGGAGDVKAYARSVRMRKAWYSDTIAHGCYLSARAASRVVHRARACAPRDDKGASAAHARTHARRGGHAQT